MKRIDVLNLAHPFAGARMLRDMLNREGFDVGRRHVARLMRRMGIAALYRKPNTSKKRPGHKVYPYLLRGLWMGLPVRDRGLGQSARSGIPGLDHDGVVVSVSRLCKKPSPSTVSRRSSTAIRAPSSRAKISRTSSRGAASPSAWTARGAWRDNIFVERLWRSIKYEEIYLHAYDSVSQTKAGIARHIDFYNSANAYSSLDKQTPEEFYFAQLSAIKQAAQAVNAIFAPAGLLR